MILAYILYNDLNLCLAHMSEDRLPDVSAEMFKDIRKHRLYNITLTGKSYTANAFANSDQCISCNRYYSESVIRQYWAGVYTE